MKKDYRLRAAKDLRILIRWGRRVETPLFRLVYRPNRLSRARFAFVASLAVDKRFSVRNRLRRRAGEWIRKRPEFMKKPIDAAIFFKKESARAPRKKFYEELEKLLQYLN